MSDHTVDQSDAQAGELVAQAQSRAIDRPLEFDAHQIQLIRDTLAPDLNPNEFALFIQTAKHKRLDPFKNQICAVMRWDKRLKRNKMSIQTQIDGYRTLAERSGKYKGQDPVMWCGKDGQWVDVWLSDEPPAAAKAGVYKAGFEKAIVRTALWKEYAPKYYSKQDGKWVIMPMWEKMGSLMLGKCAEALALRAAFPDELAGVYTREEMMQADFQEPPEILQDTSTKVIPGAKQILEAEGEKAKPKAKPKPKPKKKDVFDEEIDKLEAENRRAKIKAMVLHMTDNEDTAKEYLYNTTKFPDPQKEGEFVGGKYSTKDLTLKQLMRSKLYHTVKEEYKLWRKVKKVEPCKEMEAELKQDFIEQKKAEDDVPY